MAQVSEGYAHVVGSGVRACRHITGPEERQEKAKDVSRMKRGAAVCQYLMQHPRGYRKKKHYKKQQGISGIKHLKTLRLSAAMYPLSVKVDQTRQTW